MNSAGLISCFGPRIGEIDIISQAGIFLLCHREDAGAAELKQYAIEDAGEVARFTDAGNYRPLKTAPNLRRGWKILARDLSEVADAIEAIYPGRLGVLRAFRDGQLRTTSLRETLNRQSGIYRAAANISDAEANELIGNFCRSDGGCLRAILWKRDESGAAASTKLPLDKFEASTEAIPLLCQEACGLLVNACREVVKNR